MCKIFAMTSMDKTKVTQEFIEIVRDAVCKKSDKDGFGYALNTKDGQMWGERSIDPMTFSALIETPNETRKLGVTAKTRNAFGPLGHDDNQSFIAHGRLSTNHVSLANTHPFTNKDIALIHNGVVSDPGKVVKKLKTSCDTEILLKLWELGGMGAIEDHAAGYYALAILDKDGKLHIARDSRASLYLTYSRTVNSYLIATTEEILQDISMRMNWEIEPIEMILDDMYIVFRGNDIITKEDIAPVGYLSTIDDAKAAKALGATDDYDYSSGRYYDEDDAPSYREYNDDAPLAYDEESQETELADVVQLMNRRKRG